MTDKYEAFKEWFAKTGYQLTLINQLEYAQYHPHTTESTIGFTCITGIDLFKQFERDYCDKELHEMIRTAFQEVDKCSFDEEDIYDLTKKIKELIK